MAIKTWGQYVGEAENYLVSFDDKAATINSSVSSVVWAVQEGSATIANETLSSNAAIATVTTGSAGCSLIKVTATMADTSTIDIHYFKVNATQPAC